MKIILVFIILCSSLAAYSSENDRLSAIFEKEWQFRLVSNPMFSRSMGNEVETLSLSDMSSEALQKSADFYADLAEQLRAINFDALSKRQKINFRIFKDQVQAQLSSSEFGMEQIPFNSDSGFYSGFTRAQNNFTFKHKQDYLDYLQLLSSWEVHVNQQIKLMKTGLDRGFTQPREIIGNIPGRVRSFVSSDAKNSVFYKPFNKFPKHLSEQERQQLTARALEVIDNSINSGYTKLADFFEQEYLPNARKTLGASELPNGASFYQDQIRHYTTLNLTAQNIHQTGLDEVKRIRAEMDEIIKQVGFKGEFSEFLEFLRTDPQFYAKTEQELLMYASFIAKKMDAKLPRLFNHLPRLPYGVAPVPEKIAPTYTTGRYVSAPKGSTEPGYYWVNTYGLNKRPLYVLEALTLHEAVPGHHLQISLNQELGDLPPFRQYSYLSAFGEGWGLYSEWLGLEVGFYDDPYSNFGRLTYEMWRAVRLVVDTGIHAMGWTRQEAIDFLASNTALSMHNVKTEIDRYISWPAQALSYKIGELTIKRLRKESEQALGKDFDIREFHNVVLSQGSVPLSVLVEQVQDYIKDKTRAD